MLRSKGSVGRLRECCAVGRDSSRSRRFAARPTVARGPFCSPCLVSERGIRLGLGLEGTAVIGMMPHLGVSGLRQHLAARPPCRVCDHLMTHALHRSETCSGLARGAGFASCAKMARMLVSQCCRGLCAKIRNVSAVARPEHNVPLTAANPRRAISVPHKCRALRALSMQVPVAVFRSPSHGLPMPMASWGA